MKKIILQEIEENTNWKEKVLIRTFTKIFIKVYKKGIEKGINAML